MTCTPVRRAAGSLGRPCAATTRRRISAWRAPRPGRRRAEGPTARVSAGRACPCRRRRAARRASHAPHGRLSACRFGTIRQPVIVVCVFAMRRSSDIGMVPYIAMVASIWRVASIGRVASRLGESVPSVAEGVRPPRRAGRPGRDTLRLPSVWRAWCAACRFGTIRQPIIVVCVFAMRRSSSRLLKKSVEWDRQIDPGVLPCSQYC